jgi:hypothetical protein
MVNNKSRYVGIYDTVEEASEAYRRACIHDFGCDPVADCFVRANRAK